jgi:hypothetical protein
MAIPILTYEIIFFMMLAVIGYFCVVAIMRKMKAKRLVILRDFRNRSAPIKKFYVIQNKKNGNKLVLYKNLFQPTKTKIEPPFDLDAYSWNKVIYCFKGVTGNQDDENLVPLRVPLIGDVSATELAGVLASAIQKSIDFYGELKKYHIGDTITFDKRQGKIVSFGYEGMAFETDQATPQRIVITNLKDLLCVARTEEGINRDGKGPALSDIISREWVNVNFGVIPVDDANAILIQEKDAILSVNSAILQRETDMANKWIRQMVILTIVIGFIGIGIFFAIISYSAYTFIHSLAPGATITANAISILPKT